jgi:rhodanese-related sulfurtransferase
MKKPASSQKKDLKKETIVTIILLIIVIIAAFYVTLSYLFPEALELTTDYKNIDAETAFNLIENSNNLIIIDCRVLEGYGPVEFENYGRLDYDSVYINANPYIHFNTTEDLLIYSTNGKVAEDNFCKILVNHTYGEIYNLEGGFEAWKNAGFPITYSVPPEYIDKK